MRTLIVIPARYAASRLPGKPLAVLGDLPVVVHVAKQASKCRLISDVVVATDDPRIFDAVLEHGYRAVMTSANHPSGTDRVAEVVRQLNADFVINCQGDEPFIDPRDLDNVAQALHQHTHADMVTLRTPFALNEDFNNPNQVKVVCRDDGMALYFSRATIPFDRHNTQNCAGTYRHIGVYGFRRAALERLCASSPHYLEKREGLEQLRALAMGMGILVLDALNVGRGIDTEEDLVWAQAHVKHLGEAAFP